MPFIKKIFIAIFLLIAILLGSFIYIKVTEATCYKYKLNFIVGNHASQKTKLLGLIRNIISDETYIDSICTFLDQNIPIHFSYLVDTSIIKSSDSILLYDYITDDSLKTSKVPNYQKNQMLDLPKYPNSNNLIDFNEFSNFLSELKYKTNYSDILIYTTTQTDSLNYYIGGVKFPIYTNIDSLIKEKNEIVKNNIQNKISCDILVIVNPILDKIAVVTKDDKLQTSQDEEVIKQPVQKPPVEKPSVQKQPVQKPSVGKPPVEKQPVQKPPVQKPTVITGLKRPKNHELSLGQLALEAKDKYDKVNKFYMFEADSRQKRIIEVYFKDNSAVISKLHSSDINEITTTKLFNILGGFDTLIAQFSIK